MAEISACSAVASARAAAASSRWSLRLSSAYLISVPARKPSRAPAAVTTICQNCQLCQKGCCKLSPHPARLVQRARGGSLQGPDVVEQCLQVLVTGLLADPLGMDPL